MSFRKEARKILKKAEKIFKNVVDPNGEPKAQKELVAEQDKVSL